MQTRTSHDRAASQEESQLVTFLLKDQEFGFDIMSVQEIIRPPKIAKVPRTPSYVEGLANLRGVVLPVIDMRMRFGMDRTEETDRTRVLVVDIDGVKTGLRVDRVKQVTRVLRGDVDPPPTAIRSTTSDCLEGVVKLDNGRRIIMALNAAEVCHIGAPQRSTHAPLPTSSTRSSAPPAQRSGSADATAQLVTFRIAQEEFAFLMEHVREILRVEPPKQVPNLPEYVLGVLTVRGQILPILDLRRLLHVPSMAAEFAASCRAMRESYELWMNAALTSGTSPLDLSAPERLRKWISDAHTSSHVLTKTLSGTRSLNEKLIKQARSHATPEEMRATASSAVHALRDFEREVANNIHEDQRIIVVDANGFLLGLVVDRVNAVLSVHRELLVSPPAITPTEGLALEAVARLDDGNRLVLVLNPTSLNVAHPMDAAKKWKAESEDADLERTELQFVTFMLGAEEYGVPISQIQEIDRLSKITRVPQAAPFVEGVTNLRGEVIPVLDTRKRFDLEARASDDRTRIMIVELGGVKTGFIVDSVREVLTLSRKDIAPPPEAIHSAVDRRFISGIGNVDSGKRMVMLLDVEKILSKREHPERVEVPGR